MDAARDPFQDGDPFLEHFLPGSSPMVRKLRGMIYRLNIAHKNKRMIPSVLLRGERGVGKGHMARVIAAHLWWLRTSKGLDIEPTGADVYHIGEQAGLRTQTMTAVPETLAESILFGAKKGAYTDLKADRVGIFDSAPRDRGASEVPDPFDVFLDEIGDAPPGIQAKLLEVLETGTFRPLGSSFKEPSRTTDARIIVATNRDLEALVRTGAFRADLYDRLNWIHITLPPLREQLDQFPVIVRRVDEALCARYNLGASMPSSADVAWAQTYSWPGNYRELAQVLWEWHLFDGTRSLKEIVERRSATRLEEREDLEVVVTGEIFQVLDDVLAGKRGGFKRYGDVVEEMRRLTYGALYRYNRERQLKDEDLKRVFSKQQPTNVRKQISQNRPRSPEEK